MLNRYLITLHIYTLIGIVYGQDYIARSYEEDFSISNIINGRACVDSVITSLPFFHTNNFFH